MPAARKKTSKSKKNPLAETAVEYFAARSHNDWRRAFLKANPKERGKPRMRDRGGVLVDVNQPWDKLHPNAKTDNMLAGMAAYEAVRKFPNNREAAAEYVHSAWIARNKHDKNQPKELFKPYAQLPDVEKDKDRAHVDNIKKAIAAVSKPAKKSAPKRKTAKPKPAAAAPTFTAPQLRRMEAARKKLSQALGRDVPMEALVVAAVEAMAGMSAALETKPKPKRRAAR